MAIRLENYLPHKTFAKFQLAADNLETPFLLIDTEIVAQNMRELASCFPFAKIYYAVKANPATQIISLLRDMGANFDVASTYELDLVLGQGVSPDRVSYGNTIKKRKDIQYFFQKGVTLFVTDAEADLRNIAELAPGARVFVRILTEGGHTADWPLSRKFGCQADMVMDLLILSQELGVIPYGASFHVGSQQRDIGAWDAAIDKVRVIFRRLQKENDIHLQMINLGGGFPGNYLSLTNDLSTYATEITRFLQEDFGDSLPEIILEPGRSMVASAGVLVSEVVLISRKSNTALYRWVFQDVGMFSGLIETLGEAIKYPIYTTRSGPEEDVVLAGPTCDSADVLYENFHYALPLDMTIGDRLYWLSTGAYTSSYSSIGFNGFPPLKTYFL
ncbi:MAG: type III PLP-dependent enzyme [Magnetococcales bacterium]|nr:type III PLP-dependent enzyme [Magnetococcales bacterium]